MEKIKKAKSNLYLISNKTAAKQEQSIGEVQNKEDNADDVDYGSFNPQVLSEIDKVCNGILSGFSEDDYDLTKFQANCGVELLGKM